MIQPLSSKVLIAAAYILALPALSHAAGPPACTCKDLPAMVKEIIEQEFLQKLFLKWSGYMPREILSPGDMQDKAEAALQDAFYSQSSGKSAGTTDGAHAALGTMYSRPDCAIGTYQYDKKGKPVLDANKEKVVKPISEQDYMNQNRKSGCEAVVRFAWVHEQVHQQTCQELNAKGQSDRWKSLEFFAGNDAKAYQAGADYLRAETKKLALDCGWEGSTGPTAVPTKQRAAELAKQGAKISKTRAAKKKNASGGQASVAAIITGVEIDSAPLDELLPQWETQCSSVAAEGCGALATSIEVGVFEQIRLGQGTGGIDRETLLDAAQAELPQLKRLALSLLYNAQTPQEIEVALAALEHPSPAIRGLAQRMLSGVKDPRWQAIEPWVKRANGASEQSDATSGLVPDLKPMPSQFGLESFEGLSFRYFGSTQERAMFTSQEAEAALIKRLSKGRQVMSSADALEKDMSALQPTMEALQKEAMAAAQSGNVQKLNEIMAKFGEIQKKMTSVDMTAVNPTKNSTAILLARDSATKRPTSTATIQRDDALGETVVTFWREGGWW